MMHLQQPIGTNSKTRLRTDTGFRTRVVLCVVLGIAALFLLTKHWQHVWPYWPFLLLLACPLMHLFMHHGHGGHKMNYVTHTENARSTESDSQEGYKE